jgi:hypothetical protein
MRRPWPTRGSCARRRRRRKEEEEKDTKQNMNKQVI